MTAGESLGPMIARRRQELGRSQERLAEQLCAISGRPTVTKNEVSRYEREERIPSGDSLRSLGVALDIPLGDLERAAAAARRMRKAATGAGTSRPKLTPGQSLQVAPTVTVIDAGRDVEEGTTQRREVFRNLAAASLVVAGWPVGARDGVDLPRRITPEHVTELQDATILYRTWVSRHGGGGLGRHVSALLERASMMHSAAADEMVKNDLLDNIADLAGLGAYIARDIEAHTEATQMYHLALQAAKAAGDRHLGGHLIVRMAGHNIELRRPDDTLGLLDAARHAARSVLSPGERANQLCIEAWANAQRGDAESVHRAVGQAEDEFVRDEGTGSRDWGRQHVTEAELYSLTGAAYVDLAHLETRYAEVAIERLRLATSLRGVAHARNRTLDTLSLAEALALAGEAGEAARLTDQALDQIETITSGRLARRLSELEVTLALYANSSEAIGCVLRKLQRHHSQHRRTD